MNIEWLKDTIRSLMISRTLDDACAHLAKQFPPEDIRAARQLLEQEIGRIRILRDPPSLTDPSLEAWYPGPAEGDRFWPAYRRLLETKGWPSEDINDTDLASTKIVSMLHHPGLGAFQTRGLAIGYIQSGKTSNFTAVMAKSADVGYRMFIVMSGVTNKLRRQTQVRLDAELRDLNPELWISLTSPESDFGGAINANANAFLTQYAAQKTLCVIKKHSGRLERLLAWLRGARDPVLRSCPVMLIDDEADQAGINTGESEEERNRINRAIIDILRALPKVAYIGYTATPFANVFVDPSIPEDLYPRHFIVSLPRPRNYFGPEKLFGRDRLRPDEPDEVTDGLDMVRQVPDEEIPFLRPTGAARAGFRFDLAKTPSLERALCYFWLATAARRARGQVSEHSTLLVHSTQYAAVQKEFAEPVTKYRDACVRKARGRDKGFVAGLRQLWEEERRRVPPPAEVPDDFDTIFPLVSDVIEQTKVVVENYLTYEEDRLHYDDTEPSVYLAIGGNIFSRGLTLDGLVTSYFVRSVSAYDTLLQMGRWFGYRKGYEDLPRVWLTDELRGYFYDLATVEQEIRDDVARYEIEGITPLQFAPRIRMHPQLLITSKLKMRHAVVTSVSYGGRHEQTILFRHRDTDWLRANIAAAKALLADLDQVTQPRVSAERGSRLVFLGVPCEKIVAFLLAYRFHEDSWNISSDKLVDYVADENGVGALRTWNVAVIGQQDSRSGKLDLGLLTPVNKIIRSRVFPLRDDTANIKALMSRVDAVADLEAIPSGAGERSWADLLEYRQQALPSVPLLLLYPIEARSAPKRNSASRAPLDAIEDVVGVAFVFPPTARPTAGRSYVTADLSRVEQDVVDAVPEED